MPSATYGLLPRMQSSIGTGFVFSPRICTNVSSRRPTYLYQFSFSGWRRKRSLVAYEPSGRFVSIFVHDYSVNSFFIICSEGRCSNLWRIPIPDHNFVSISTSWFHHKIVHKARNRTDPVPVLIRCIWSGRVHEATSLCSKKTSSQSNERQMQK